MKNLINGERRRWVALAVVCMGQLMMVLDGTIVNVALPSMQRDLGFSQANLAWVLDAYLIAFGSFLLLAGRLGDLLGRKRMFLTGVVMFTLASVACGLAGDQVVLIVARFVQGLGGAVASAAVLALLVTRVSAAVGAGDRDERVHVHPRRRRFARAARRRRAHAVGRLALDLLHQRADRDRDLRARIGADQRDRAPRARARRRRGRRGAGHGRR